MGVRCRTSGRADDRRPAPWPMIFRRDVENTRGRVPATTNLARDGAARPCD